MPNRIYQYSIAGALPQDDLKKAQENPLASVGSPA